MRFHQDHPRSRGEYLYFHGMYFESAGSSPLSRGIPLRAKLKEGRRGIIPALAGNTGVAQAGLLAIEDHPRSRGEYRILSEKSPQAGGSSPLSRGIPPMLLGRGCRLGIIPALAGNTRSYRPHGPGPPDHPRSRGEYPTALDISSVIFGSSPLSRGIPLPIDIQAHTGRIIPALAGNTSLLNRTSGRFPDHPRSRGEYY